MARIFKSLPVPSQPWIPKEFHLATMRTLQDAALTKFDNNRSLPLKSGGKTDLYVNLRNMRGDPEAAHWLAELYAHTLRWLNVDRFVEVPSAVSGLAGHLSVLTGIPYITIRAEAKEGRVSNADIIGEFHPGERVVIIDDVITDGASKLRPYQLCTENGLDVVAFIVLVDREQGWQSEFKKLGIRAPVWAGMTLHDLRREITSSDSGLRCSSAAEDANPIIVALDGKSWNEVLPIADRLRTTGTILKVNDLMFDRGIDWLLPELSVYGRIMADLKGHEIPNSMKNILRHFRKCAPWAVTIHASGGPEMIEAARKALPEETILLAVTVLTSIDPKTCDEVYHRRPLTQVKHLAKLAWEAGADGFVCSPEENSHLRNAHPDSKIVTPAVRSPGKDTGDQKRVDTPANAIDNGSNHVVMGRQILEAPDPVEEVNRVLRDELKIEYFTQAAAK